MPGTERVRVRVRPTPEDHDEERTYERHVDDEREVFEPGDDLIVQRTVAEALSDTLEIIEAVEEGDDE